jgi:hypothetical protein
MLGTWPLRNGWLVATTAAGLFGAHFSCHPVGTCDSPCGAASEGVTAAGGQSAGGESVGTNASTGGTLAQGGEAGIGGGFDGTGQVPNFSLVDVNATSPTVGDPVSPRDFLMQVSAWYFAHAT